MPIGGRLIQGGVKWAATVIALLVAVAGASVAATVEQPRRPQDEAVARGPRPYTDREISFTSENGAIKLAGTLSVPDGRGSFPAVLLIAAADLVSDAHAAFRYLAARPDIDSRRVGVIGHSEGGSIGPAIAAVDPHVAFVVAMAGSGLSGEVRMTEHEVYVAQLDGASPEQQAKVRALCKEISGSCRDCG